MKKTNKPENPQENAQVVLASKSAVRAQLLRDAGLDFACAPASVDEAEIKSAMKTEPVEAVAQALAEMKARHVSRKFPDALVIGADQILECDGARYDKPADLNQARKQLAALRGRPHDLVSAAMVVRDGVRLWHHVDRVRLEMRPFSDDIMQLAEGESLALLEEQAAADPAYRKVYEPWKKARGEAFAWWGAAERAYSSFAFKPPGA